MPTPVELVTSRLTRDGKNFKCPAHDDRRGSLSVREGRDGRALVFCHAGCRTVDVLHAIGLQMRDLMPIVAGRGHSAQMRAQPRGWF